MINETTLTISLIILMLFILAGVIYLFFVIMERLKINRVTALFYAFLQASVSIIIAGVVFQWMSPLTDPSELHFHHLLNYSFYPVIGWNVFLGIVAAAFIGNGAVHHLVSYRKSKLKYRD
ncbi:hypothetical protein MM300_01830 [Evansella sp. LMS18]|uniref:hypothetical protein n=1 Tax=Evansella sp. LMS18 TaxID=2924033 RepID=UPI0020D117BC|nr:hypothetical protein [Evansella sp. LMS18]UTR11097.1 hypothetical protein MM300_01830 [Evansella sp. LMS18]